MLLRQTLSTLSTRQIDEFGEVVKLRSRYSVTVSTVIILFLGPNKNYGSFGTKVACGANNLTSQKSEFLSSFIDKTFDMQNAKLIFHLMF